MDEPVPIAPPQGRQKLLLDIFKQAPDLLWLRAFARCMGAFGIVFLMNAIGPIIVMAGAGIMEVVLEQQGTPEDVYFYLNIWSGAAAAVYCIIVTVIICKTSWDLARRPLLTVDLESGAEQNFAKQVEHGQKLSLLLKLIFWLTVAFIVFQLIAGILSLGTAFTMGYMPLASNHMSNLSAGILDEDPNVQIEQVIDLSIVLMLMIAFAMPYLLLLPMYIYLRIVRPVFEHRGLMTLLKMLYILIGIGLGCWLALVFGGGLENIYLILLGVLVGGLISSAGWFVVVILGIVLILFSYKLLRSVDEVSHLYADIASGEKANHGG